MARARGYGITLASANRKPDAAAGAPERDVVRMHGEPAAD